MSRLQTLITDSKVEQVRCDKSKCASNLTKHLTNSNILFELQHGFREMRSCETQLVMLVDEISKNMQMGKQTDLIPLDFSKAFDKVAHEKLISKLHFY